MYKHFCECILIQIKNIENFLFFIFWLQLQYSIYNDTITVQFEIIKKTLKTIKVY